MKEEYDPFHVAENSLRYQALEAARAISDTGDVVTLLRNANKILAWLKGDNGGDE